MRPGWRGRVKEWCCRHFGHRLMRNPLNQTIVCTRCQVLLAGPLTYPNLPAHSGRPES
jgi:hypothetical protein